MKNIKLLITALLLIFIIACTSDKENNVVVANYTGVLVGSSGSYSLKFSETNSNATITFDGQTYVLTSSATLKKGETLTLTDGSVSLTIATDSNGKNPNIKFNIPGHQVSATIADATYLTENYLGEATITKDGVLNYQATFNVTLTDNNQFQAIQKIIKNGGGVDEGKVETINGVYTKTNSIIVFTYNKDGETITLALNLFANKISGLQTDPEIGVTAIELNKV